MRKRFLLVMNRGQAGITLPYTFDPSALGDGALPSPWAGSTFAISSGVVVNTPTLGTEMLSSPGLEGTYTDGVEASLTKNGTPTCAESADAHGGSKAQQMAHVSAGQSLSPYNSGAAEQYAWYQASAWGKRTSGSGFQNLQLIQTSMFNTPADSITAATYTQYKVSGLAVATTAFTMYSPIGGGATAATTIVDDISLKKITTGSLFAILNQETQTDVVLKLRTPGLHASYTDGTHFGIIARANASANPTSYLMAYIKRRANGSTLGQAGLLKLVSGTPSAVVAEANVTLAANADLEVRLSGTTVQLFYNSIQVGTDQTVSDAGIVSNKYHGIWSAGGNSLNRFFLSAN